MSKRKKRRLPPMNGPVKHLAGLTVKAYTVGSWCPTPDGTGKPEAVTLKIDVDIGGEEVGLFLRLKNPRTVDVLIQGLLRHKRDVWPDSP